MLRNLLDEIKHRHLWPIPLVALLVAIAAPLLFLKSTAQDASPASADAVTAPAGQLPARAQRLLATSTVAKSAARRPARNANDPFQPPSHGAAPAAADPSADAPATGATTTTAAPAAPAAPADPVPVVITNSDGTPSASPETPAAPAAPDKASAAPAVTRAVTTRFGEQYPAPVQHSVPRLQTFLSDDSVVAIFVKYSPARDKAVFAIAPSTVVTGNVVCRRQGGVCRYVDIAVGKHVRLATQAADGTLVSSRLDVVRIDQAPEPAATPAADSAPANGSCLLTKLLTLTTDDPPLPRDAC